MAYATVADMVTRFGERQILELTDRDVSGSIDTAVADQALTDASAEIDGYLAARYSLPLASVPGILVPYCCDLARLRLYPDAIPEAAAQAAAQARAFLADVARGRIGLGADFEADGPAGGLAQIASAAPARRRSGIGL